MQQSYPTPPTTTAPIYSLPANFPTSSSLDSIGSTNLADPNSPDLFKQNIQLALDYVARVNSLARSCLNGIHNAYQETHNPVQTEAELTALDGTLRALLDFLRQTGLGACPLPSSDSVSDPPTEQHLIEETGREVQQLYEQLKGVQASSGVVASLLSGLDTSSRA